MSAVPDQMPAAWNAQTHAELPVFLDQLWGVAHTSCEVADCRFLQSCAQLWQEVVIALGQMDDDVKRPRPWEALLDESQAGPLLATLNQLGADKEELIRRNQNLQAATATHSQEELTTVQAVVIAAEE